VCDVIVGVGDVDAADEDTEAGRGGENVAVEGSFITEEGEGVRTLDLYCEQREPMGRPGD
jgi:hypothetical protein